MHCCCPCRLLKQKHCGSCFCLDGEEGDGSFAGTLKKHGGLSNHCTLPNWLLSATRMAMFCCRAAWSPCGLRRFVRQAYG